MIGYIYKRTLNILKGIPVKLWGLSLLSGLLNLIAVIFGVLPIITVPVTLALSAGVSMLYLDAYNGKDADSNRLFCGFKDFKHVAGGMCWKSLWLLLWFLIPIAGFVFIVIKRLAYAFVPYILIEDKSVSATDALKKSMSMTKGYKGQMFLAIILPAIIFGVVSGILSLFAKIPFVGLLFAFINFIVSMVYSLFSPLFLGMVEAGYYEQLKNPPAQSYSAPIYQPQPPVYPPQPPVQPEPPQPPVQPEPAQDVPQPEVSESAVVKCPVCDCDNPSTSKFCIKCGSKLN